MSKSNRIFLLLSVCLFALLIGLAVYKESSYFLYAASAIPLLIVPFLPDIKTNQYIKKGNSQPDVWLARTADESGPDRIVIGFEPGFIAWNKRRLYFCTDDIPAESGSAKAPSRDITASLSVLKFDLVPHPKKAGWVGIELANLAQRTQGMSYTVDDINRLILSAEDVEEIAKLPGVTTAASAQSQNRGVQA
ncbi:hypothetical protein [Paenibacillus hamazuiensis]|uniref:hypothetical protein n=1 Tax=Paenibacillus hamazuiensis TaxID=2936508 RepID=UPI00200C08B7|nr:hypothetical protein [Paenibacillus hamazuiensis]